MTGAGQARDPLPLYHRVYLLLRQQIAEGAWTSETAMPGEHELAEMHGVSRITVRRALQRLEQEGRVLRRRGAGTFAQPPPPAKRQENLGGLLEDLLAMGLRTKVRLLSFEYVAAPPEVAAALELPAGSIVQKSVRVRSARGTPFSYLTAWVPEAIGRHFRAEDLAARPLLHLLDEAGAAAVRAEQVISARLADATVATQLRVEIGSALLWVRRQVRDGSGRVIESIEVLYRPDLYEYRIAMDRSGGVWDVRTDMAGRDATSAA
jgi:GntR family transcriptional regulator